MIAQLIYWYPLDDNTPRDGGSQRAFAWEAALQNAGFEVRDSPIHSSLPGDDRPDLVGSLKRRVLPMPMQRQHVVDADADLVIATVPAVFRSVIRQVRPHQRLILDWMDRWSVNARTMSTAHWASVPGGRAQSLSWRRRESRFPGRATLNTYAGYADAAAAGPGSRGVWLPTPTRTAVGRIPKGAVSVTRLGMIGNFAYAPNRESLDQFLARYSTRLRDRDIELVVAGYGSDRYASDESFTVLGPVDDLDAFYASVDAVVVPIWHGGGIKVKAVEALAHGVPVFVTDHVREGFSPEFSAFMTDLDELFANQPLCPPPVPAETFDARFSFAAFQAAVIDALNDVGPP